MILPTQSAPSFGPGGNSESFYSAGNKSTLQAPKWVKELGLDAFEYEAGNGITVGEASLRAIGDAARAEGIRLSIHAPYFISLSGVEEEKRLKSIAYVEKSLWAAELLGADTVVIHSGSAAKLERAEAMRLSLDTLARLAEAVGNEPAARLGIETMGKLNQLGTLSEVIEQCKVAPIFTPVVDFGHLYARSLGEAFPDADSYRRVFDEIANRLGDRHARYLHCHFSKIEYTKAGEKKHLTFASDRFGPLFEPLAEAIVREGVCPRVICESAGSQAEDALFMKQTWLNAAEKNTEGI
ncbi:MAG: endonuclease IV [Ruminococcaceae bacterium]|nr:endonuclease IV [Oscillospiraceae bacterium]